MLPKNNYTAFSVLFVGNKNAVFLHVWSYLMYLFQLRGGEGEGGFWMVVFFACINLVFFSEFLFWIRNPNSAHVSKKYRFVP